MAGMQKSASLWPKIKGKSEPYFSAVKPFQISGKLKSTCSPSSSSTFADEFASQNWQLSTRQTRFLIYTIPFRLSYTFMFILRKTGSSCNSKSSNQLLQLIIAVSSFLPPRDGYYPEYHKRVLFFCIIVSLYHRREKDKGYYYTIKIKALLKLFRNCLNLVL